MGGIAAKGVGLQARLSWPASRERVGWGLEGAAAGAGRWLGTSSGPPLCKQRLQSCDKGLPIIETLRKNSCL